MMVEGYTVVPVPVRSTYWQEDLDIDQTEQKSHIYTIDCQKYMMLCCINLHNMVIPPVNMWTVSKVKVYWSYP